MKRLQGLSVVLIVAALGGCDIAASGSCSPPPPVNPKLPAVLKPNHVGGWESEAVDCIHRWAYLLARSDEPAPVVAMAAMAACADSVQTLAIALHARAHPEDPLPLRGTVTRLTRPLEPMVEQRLRAQALFRVIEARAGRCKAS